MSISAFTPSNTPPEILEAILVQREPILRQLMLRLQRSIRDKRPSHSLYVAPRGNGKTMLVTLAIDRLKRISEISDLFRIAWLGEDESFSQLVHVADSIANRLASAYPAEFSATNHRELARLENDQKAEAIMKSVQRDLKGRVLLLVTENLDRTLGSMKKNEQLQWRSLLQEMGCISILATAQQLADELRSRDDAFHGFFDTVHLQPLGFADAVSLMTQIARVQGDEDLAKFIQTPAGRHRARVIHHLAGGSHRLYVVLSEFLTAEKMDDLIKLFESIAEPLANYYQERNRDLPAQQGRIVQVIAEQTGALQVKEIAMRTFIDERTCSKQLSELRSKGYVRSYRRGRASFYEIAEPLMRLSIDEKNRHGKPIRLVAQFIKAWFPPEHLASSSSSASAKVAAYCQVAAAEPMEFMKEVHHQLERDLASASKANNVALQQDLESELLVSHEILSNAAGSSEFPAGVEGMSDDERVSRELRIRVFGDAADRDVEDWIEHQDSLSDIIDAPGTAPLQRARALQARAVLNSQKEHYPQALEDTNRALVIVGISEVRKAELLVNRGIVHGRSDGSLELAIADYSAVISMQGAPVDKRVIALFNRGITYGQSGDAERAIADYTSLIEIPDAPVDLRAKALLNRGVAFGRSGDAKRAITDYTSLIEMADAPVDQRADALFNRGITYKQLGDAERAITDYTLLIEIPDAPVGLRAIALFTRGIIYGQSGDAERAITDYTSLIDMLDAPVDQRADALFNRGITYGQSGSAERAITDYTSLIEIPDAPVAQRAIALLTRGITYGQLGDAERAISDYTQLIEIPDAPADQRAIAIFNRGTAHGQSGDAEHAITDYTALIEMADAPVGLRAIALFTRGNTYGQLGDAERAIFDCTQLIEMPDAPADQRAIALLNRGITYEQSGDVERATTDYTSFIEMPNAPAELLFDAMEYRARCHIEQGRLLNALEDLSNALNSPVEKSGRRIRNLTNRVAVLQKLGRDSEANKDSSEVLKLISDNPEMRLSHLWSLGSMHWRLGEFPRAAETFEMAVDHAVAKKLGATNSRFGLIEPLVMTAGFTLFQKRLAEAFVLGDREGTGYGGTPKDLLATLLHRPPEDWPRYANAIAEVFCQFDRGADLGRGIVLSVRTLIDREFSEASIKRWGDAWLPLASRCPELQIPIESLLACIGVIQSRTDIPLFDVPVEIRRLVRPLLTPILGEPELE